MNVPIEAYNLARTFEGLRLEPYRDAAGYWTVGYGHLLSRDKTKGASDFSPITHKEAEALLASDLVKASNSVVNLCPVPLTEGQFSALIDFTFNLGGGNLEASTLRHLINRGEMMEATEQFGRWVYAGGVKLPGLIRRRAEEARLFAF